MLRRLTLAAAAVLAMGSAAMADPIEGNWRTDSGSTAAITSCGSAFCITLKSGKFKGKQIGSMKPQGDGRYSGKITDPESDKTYSGKATLSGNALKMSGCVLGGLICRGQNWSRL